MKLIEYRIFMPLTVEETRVAHRFTMTELEKQNTGGGEGVEVLQDDFFQIPHNRMPDGRIPTDVLPGYEDHAAQKAAQKSRKSVTEAPTTPTDEATQSAFVKNVPDGANPADYGVHTRKLYKIASKMPWYIRKVTPKDMLIIKEKSWNMYPQMNTVLTNEYFKSNFRIEFRTVVRECPSGEPEHNAHGLSKEELDKREVITIDIADPVSAAKFKEDEDPTRFRSVKTDRGPLPRGDWVRQYRDNGWPLTCVYRLAMFEFKVLGVQRLAENFARNTYKDLFAVFHRQQFCWMDKWYGMTMEDLRRVELETMHQLERQINEGELSSLQVQVEVEGAATSPSGEQLEDQREFDF